jgi:hypothetical protein
LRDIRIKVKRVLPSLFLAPIITKRKNHSNQPVVVFCTGKNRVVNITRSNSEMVLRTTKHTMIYPASAPSLEVIAICPIV